MDLRLYLLMHTTRGLKLSFEDICALLDEALDPHDPEAVKASLHSLPARQYLARNPDWIESAFNVEEKSRALGIRWIYIGQSEYPENWLGLSSRPLIFSYQGDPVWMKRQALSVVGSRTPATETLRWMQTELPKFLKQSKPMVVSGGARGIDQWAHRLAMDCGCPTVCMLPTGLLNRYPENCEELWERVLKTGGALVSTCSLEEPLRKGYFHVRNLWIAGMGKGCFVVEANRRSGSALTAQKARDEGRPICTLPVWAGAERGQFNLDLLNESATLIRDYLDLVTFWNRLNPVG